MALQKQVVPLVIDQGLNTKTDIKQEEPGFLRQAQNVVYETIHKLKKRNGYDELDLYDLDNNRIVGQRTLSKLGTELVLLTETQLYAYSPSLQKCSPKGSIYPARLRSEVVVKNSLDQNEADGLVVDEFKVFAWSDSEGNVRYSVQDSTDNAFLVSNGLIGQGDRPCLARINNVVYVVYGDGADVCYRSFSIAQPASLDAVVIIASDRDLTDGLLDSKSVGLRVMVSYNSATNLKLFAINDDGSTSSIVGVTGENATHALDVSTDAAQRVILTYSDGADLKYTVYPYILTSPLLAPTVLDTTDNIVTCCAIEESTAGTYRFFYEVEQAGVGTNYVKTVTATVTGTVAASSVYMRSVGLGARSFRYADETYTVLITESPIQATYFVMNSLGHMVTKFANQTASNVLPWGSLPEVSALTDSEFLIPALFRNRTKSDNGTFFSTTGVGSARLDFTPSTGYSTAELAGTLHIASGALKMYDGATVVEDGFNVFPELLELSTTPIEVTVTVTQQGVVGVTPEIQQLTFAAVPGSGSFTLTFNGAETTAPILFSASTTDIKNAIEALTYITSTVSVTGTFAAGFEITYDNSMGDIVGPTATSSLLSPLSGGFMSDGNYAYVAVYAWTDNAGRTHRSAPTLTPLTVVLSGGGSTQTVTLNVPTLRVTEKENVSIEIYRTENDGSTYYKATDDLDPLLNDKTVDSVPFTDTLSDANLISQEILYTTGGVLENIPPGAVHQITVFNGERIAYLDEERSRVRFSKITDEGGPVEYSDGIYRDVDPTAGELTAIRAMQEKLMIFSADGCFQISGEGPLNTGQQDTFTKPEILSTDVGCIQPDSLVLTPNGLMFKSRKGIWNLGAGGLTYIGAMVELYNPQTVTSGVVVGELNQVRFTLSETRSLVYNYNLARWATFENAGGISAVTIGNDYYYLREDGALYKENRTSFGDASSPIRFKIETGWLSLVALQGIQRAYHAMLLGDFKSNHRLRVRVAYDFNETWVHEVIISPADFLSTGAYGDDSPYGTESPYGGNGVAYQPRINFKKQKCQAMKLSIEDVQDEIGEGLSLSAITLRVGAKEGSGKVSAARKFGTS